MTSLRLGYLFRYPTKTEGVIESNSDNKRAFYQFRISTILLLLAIAALVTNQIVMSRGYEKRIRKMSIEIELMKLERDRDNRMQRFGSGHPTVKDLSQKLDDLRKEAESEDSKSE
jgi:hypothetical protein